MQLASSPAFPEPLLAALPQLSEKLRQGFASKNRAWHPGKIASKFMVALGLLAVLVLNLCSIPLLGQETVYNFTVAKDHDYFVGETGFLVHNAPPCGCKWGQEGHHMVPENKAGFGPAKGVLGRAGIDINDLANLLPLDYNYHRRIHTDAYRDWINETLTEAESNGDSIGCTLKNIGGSILNGTAVF